jgi:protein-S-isoprenylcysteine O-methyltransferase Ste14
MPGALITSVWLDDARTSRVVHVLLVCLVLCSSCSSAKAFRVRYAANAAAAWFAVIAITICLLGWYALAWKKRLGRSHSVAGVETQSGLGVCTDLAH